MIVHTGYGMGDNFLERREVLDSDFFFFDIFSFFTGYEKGHIKSMHFSIFLLLILKQRLGITCMKRGQTSKNIFHISVVESTLVHLLKY